MQSKRTDVHYIKTPIEDDYDIGAVLGSYVFALAEFDSSLQLARNTVQRLIWILSHRGNYSTVKLGTHKKTGEKRAVKIINKENAGAKGIKMVQTEVEIMLDCQHRNIVKWVYHT